MQRTGWIQTTLCAATVGTVTLTVSLIFDEYREILETNGERQTCDLEMH